MGKLIILFCLVCHLCQAQVPPPGYTLVFNQDFRNIPNLSIISPGTGWGPVGSGVIFTCHPMPAGYFGNAYMTGPSETEKNSYTGQTVPTPDPFSLANEWDPSVKLNKQDIRLTAYHDANICHWRTGCLCTVDGHGNGFSQALGYWEVRMWLPNGVGTWPAFFLNDQTGLLTSPRTTPAAEIDVAEMYGTQPGQTYDWMSKIHMHVHIWSPSGVDSPHYDGLYTTPVDANGVAVTTQGFHTYGCLVKTDLVHFYFDGVEIFNCPATPETAHPLYPIVDMALGGGWPVNIAGSAFARISYIKCWAPPQ